MASKSKDMIRIKLFVRTGFVNCKYDGYINIPREEWENMSARAQEAELNELAAQFLNNHIEYGAYVIEDPNEEE